MNLKYSMKKITLQIYLLALLTSFAASVAQADTITNIQTVGFKVLSSSGAGCPGSFTGYAYMTNDAATMWLTPPTNCTSATFTDISGYPAPYFSAECVTRKLGLLKWCDTNGVTFPATSSNTFELYVYVKNSGLTNGQPLTLQVVWQ